MECVTPFVSVIIDSMMVPIKEHLGFFFSSTKHVANMTKKLSNLNVAKYYMEEKKKDALINDRLVPDSLHLWLEKVETITRKTETIQTAGNGCLNILTRYTTGKISFDILQEIDDLLGEQNKIEWSNKQRPIGMVINSPGPSTSQIDYNVIPNIFPSRVSIFNDILKSLEPDNKTQMMALWGPGGVGKTTMMEEIKKFVEKKGKFQYILRVDIGRKYDPNTTKKYIAKCMGVDLHEETKQAEVERLRESFERLSKEGKKIFIILDDVWEAIDLNDIGLPSSFPTGFKVLVTSRNEKVCIKMDIDTKSIFKIHGLEEADANSFFWETVKISNGDGELQKIGKDILNKCGGLPIAIKTIALALKGEEKYAWEATKKNLQRHKLKDIEDLQDVVIKIFEISYSYLKKDEDKAIFVLCGLYPDDYDIFLEELLRYGWGLQFFKKADSLVEARKQTNMSVHNLLSANLLTKSNTTGCVKIHDLARDFVLSNISKFKQASIVNHGDKFEWPTHESCERLLLTCTGMSNFPQDFYYPNLELLKLMNGDKLLRLPEDFHKQMEKLKVLAYAKMQYPLSVVSLCCSISLHTLCLDFCPLVDNDISLLGNLVNLEVLSLAYCGISKLPSTIKELKMLKLLDLNGCFDLYIDDGVFQNLGKLEELYMRVSRNKSIRFSDANCGELKLISGKLNALEVEFFENILEPKNVSFENLQRFRISMGCFLDLYWSDEHSFKNTLKLVSNSNDVLECKFYELFSHTEELHLSVKDMSNVGDISMSPTQTSTFFNLKYLHVFECEELTHLFTIPVANGLKKLESLTVSSCSLLKSIASSCDNVNVIDLPHLVELKLDNLPNFTSIILDSDISATQPPLLNKEVMIPNLSRLKINGLKKLKQIWACDYTSGEEDNISMLKVIEVNDCNSLVNLFPCNPMQLLTHLEELKVNNCCSIEVVFNIDLGKIKQHISNLRSIRVSKLDELRELWRINEENYSGHLICGFQAVETIDIGNCKKFKNVFTPITANFDMSALINIYIEDVKVEDVEISGISKVDEDMSIVAFPSYYLTRAFNKIRKIDFRSFEGAKVLFEIETLGISGELVSAHQQQSLPLLPRLEELYLERMDTLSHVWKCNNWNKFFILHKHQPQSSFQNLTKITLLHCNGIKYLFSPLMSKLLSSLKKLQIGFCESMEEVVSNRDDDHVDDEVLTTSTTTFFPCLKDLRLVSLPNLKHIGGGVAKCSRMGVVPWSLCQYPTEIHIKKCPSLSTLIPSDAATQMQKLQELTINDCKSLVEVFESKEINNISSSSSNIDQGSVSFPGPKTITNLHHHQLTNLKKLQISICDILEYIFTFPTLESLKKLEELRISSCKAMKAIVREEHGEETSSKVVFPRLKSIELVDLPNLVGFFIGMNTDFEWQSLDHLMIDKCPQMMVFTSGESIAPKLKYIHTTLGKHDVECILNFRQTPPPSRDSVCPAAQGATWSFHNLIEIDLKYYSGHKKVVPSNELQQLQILERIHVSYSWSVTEVFEVANNESPTVVTFPKLREVELELLFSLEYIWKSNEWTILEFPNLTTLSIIECNKLKHVFTPSMVGGLMKLQELRITWCEKLEVIVKKEEEECDGKVGEIRFPCLKSLELYSLKSLKGFWLGKEDLLFPSMNTLIIKKCPEIKVFSDRHAIAHELKLVETSFGVFQAEEGISSFASMTWRPAIALPWSLSVESTSWLRVVVMVLRKLSMKDQRSSDTLDRVEEGFSKR
ncbi:hypothetical protein E3N88_00586 [Mikania micrantha]|uniref:Uncharacterized protein n=1 Tax=Mikania micrantha TaxID=192012 RepID=A0A5N6Q178_9ASTR|nr:hypothetical protein E3N88_00586 [Mikania micrantha]